MYQFVLIFLGGGLGSAVRYYLGKAVQQALVGSFPWGTLAVNVAASFVLGGFVGAELSRSLAPTYRLLVAVGFCGGFSTFSTFSNDTLGLLQANRWLEAVLNVALNVVLCLLATFAGIFLTK